MKNTKVKTLLLALPLTGLFYNYNFGYNTPPKAPNKKNTQNTPPIIKLINEDKTSVVDLYHYLLSHHHKSLNEQDEYGYTILHYAVMNQKYGIILALLTNKKVNRNIKNKAGKTPLDKAKEYNFMKVIKLFETF